MNRVSFFSLRFTKFELRIKRHFANTLYVHYDLLHDLVQVVLKDYSINSIR